MKGAIKGDRIIEHEELLKNSLLFDSLTPLESFWLNHLRTKQEIKEAYQRSKDWIKVINEYVTIEDSGGCEELIDCIEEIYQIKITHPAQLRTLIKLGDKHTGILLSIFMRALISKYERALEIALENGAKYKDLLLIDIENIPFRDNPVVVETVEKTKYNRILGVIFFKHQLSNISFHRPDFSTIAESLEAPLSVIIEAFKLYGDRYSNISDTLGKPYFIEEKLLTEAFTRIAEKEWIL